MHKVINEAKSEAKAEYASGKTLAVVDALSRGPEQSSGDGPSHDDVAAHIIDAVVCQPPSRG